MEMKKNYVTPRVRIMGVEPMSMICTSVQVTTISREEFITDTEDHAADPVDWQDTTMTVSDPKERMKSNK